MALQKNKFYIIGLLFFILAIYANAYTNGFLLDDEFLLVKNRFIDDIQYFWRIFTSSSTMGAGGNDSFYRPMQTLAYFVVCQIFGLSIPAFHALNIGLHIVNAILLFQLAVTKFKIRPWLAFSAALLWSSHPLHVEAVTYMSATADTLYSLFILAGLLSLERMWLALLFYVCALMSKESGVVFLPLAITLIAVHAKEPLKFKNYLRTWPLFVLTAVYLILRKTVLDFDDTFSFYPEPNIYTENMLFRFYTFLATLPKYFLLLIWPEGLHMEREFPVFTIWAWPVVAGAVILTVAILAVPFDYKRSVRGAALAALWFFMAHVPHTGVLLPVNSFFLEHWMYMPSMGLALGFFWWLNSFKNLNVKVVVGVSLAISLALGVCTFYQNRVWATPITFYEHILSVTKGTQRVHNNLGMAYSESNQSDRAIEHYLKAIEIKDSYPQVRHNLGEEYLKRGDVQSALVHLHRAVEINPQFYHSYKDLAMIYQRLGNREQETHYYNLYLQTRPP